VLEVITQILIHSRGAPFRRKKKGEGLQGGKKSCYDATGKGHHERRVAKVPKKRGGFGGHKVGDEGWQWEFGEGIFQRMPAEKGDAGNVEGKKKRETFP